MKSVKTVHGMEKLFFEDGVRDKNKTHPIHFMEVGEVVEVEGTKIELLNFQKMASAAKKRTKNKKKFLTRVIDGKLYVMRTH
ncbi:hypothetical protein VPSG_00029 [Vibrio phage pYD38-B]|uniref:hypothetical protein n=1 Tax=Vibrio phage pYD38-B TaxID=929835 RepID=UPI0003425B29|nr:hypothetical protein VPSG_00029 [Vibrio phage pYD38-B]AGN34348.1 hypothetical protein VPSG_00029 [Vibrio phage pYD38-B]